MQKPPDIYSTKICTSCKEEKSLQEFTKGRDPKDGLKYVCKTCSSKYQNQVYITHREEHRARCKQNYTNKKDEYASRNKIWALNNPEKMLEYGRQFRIRNVDAIRIYDNKWKKERKKSDLEYRLRVNIRERLRDALRKEYKKGKYIELLGCSIKEYKQYLENQFTPEMSWENYGSYWEIDHIKQLNLFDLMIEEEKQVAFHHTNTRPLTKEENRRRSKTK